MTNEIETQALLLIAHGSRRPEANADLEKVADQLRERGWKWAVASYLELAEPTIHQGGIQCVESGAQEVILVPWFLSAGMHVRRDLRDARQKLAEAFPEITFRLAEPLGTHPFLLDVVEQRVQQCCEQ